MTIDVSSIGIKFENFMQAGCRDLGSHRGGTVRVLPKAHYFAQTVTLFSNIFRIASTLWIGYLEHYDCL